jgi:hypothetical protein
MLVPIYYYIFSIDPDIVEIGEKKRVSNDDMDKKKAIGILSIFFVGIVWYTVKTLRDLQFSVPLLYSAFVGVVLLITIIYIYYTTPIEMEKKTIGRVRFFSLIAMVILAGYVFRGIGLHFSYFVEVLPFLAIISAVALDRVYAKINKNEQYIFYGLCILISLGLCGLLIGPHLSAANGGFESPYTSEGAGTVSNIQYASEDIGELAPENATYFTAQPLFVLQIGEENYAHFSRQQWLYRGHSDPALRENITNQITAGLSSGEVDIIIYEGRTKILLANSPPIAEAVTTNYCRKIENNASMRRVGIADI